MMNRLLMVGPSGSNNWLNLLAGTTHDIVDDAAGNSYVHGYSNALAKYFLAKISPSNEVSWCKEVNSSGTGGRICLNSTGTTLYLVYPVSAYAGFNVATFSADGTLVSQFIFHDTLFNGYPSIYSAATDDTSVFISMWGYDSTAAAYNGIFKLNPSGAISAKRGYSNVVKISDIAAQPSGTGVYFVSEETVTGNANIAVCRVSSSTLSNSWSRYINYNTPSGGSFGYGIAIDASETTAYVAGSIRYNPGPGNRTAGVVASITSITSSPSLNWTRVVYDGTAGNGFNKLAVDASGSVYCLGSFYDGSIYKSSILKLSSANTVLFHNAVDTDVVGFPDQSAISARSPSSVKVGYRHNKSSVFYGAHYSLPVNGSATGTYAVGTVSVTYGAYSPTYPSLTMFWTSFSLSSATTFTNWDIASSSYTFPNLTITRMSKDIP